MKLARHPDNRATKAGLFAEIGPSGLVRDLGLVNSTATSHYTHDPNVLGLLAVYNTGTIKHSFVTGKIQIARSAFATGGIAGGNSATMVDSHASVAVSGGTVYTAGDLVGVNGATIIDCFTDGAVGASVDYSGDLIGINDNVAAITGSHAGGDVSAAYDEEDWWDSITSARSATLSQQAP